MTAGLAGAVGSTVQAQDTNADAPDPIDAAGQLIGRAYSDAHKQLMRGGLARTRAALAELRDLELPVGLEYGFVFDPVLPGMTLPAGGIEISRVIAQDLPLTGSIESLAFASAGKLAKLLRGGQVTSVQLTRMYLDRLKQHGPKLNCVITLTEDLALKQAAAADERLQAGDESSPLLGIPYGAKDLLATKGIATTFGVSPMKDQLFDFDATVVQRLEEAGAVLLAKLSLGELAMDDTWFGGQTKNPWNTEQGSSGSSAGSCSAVAAGLCAFAIGSETLGSIVSPSVRCGTAGLRPTFGRVPRTGALTLCRTMDKLGPIVRRVGDAQLVLEAIAGPDGQDPTCREAGLTHVNPKGLRIGIDTAAFEAIEQRGSDSVKAIYADARDTAEQLFGQLTPFEFPSHPLLGACAINTVEAESAEALTELIQSGGMDELVQQDADNWPNIFRRAGLLPAVDYLRLQRVRRQLMQEMDEKMREVDAVITVPRMSGNLLVTNLTGHPCVLGRAGIEATGERPQPYQIEFVGKVYGESELLAAATLFEDSVGEAVDTWPGEFAPSA